MIFEECLDDSGQSRCVHLYNHTFTYSQPLHGHIGALRVSTNDKLMLTKALQSEDPRTTRLY